MEFVSQIIKTTIGERKGRESGSQAPKEVQGASWLEPEAG